MNIQGGDRRQRLRRATDAAHRRLDGFVDVTGFLASRVRYELYLQATWMARRPAERALDASGAASLYGNWPQRRVCNWLRQDLLDVSATCPLDHAETSPGLLSNSQSLGVLYVLEGSALGAGVLRKRAFAIGMTSDFGARHLAHQTSQPGTWAEFLDTLMHTPMSAADEDQCVSAALATFERFQQAFEHLTPVA